MLSPSFKALFSNPEYNLPSKPFNHDYIVGGALTANKTVSVNSKNYVPTTFCHKKKKIAHVDRFKK